MFQFKLQAAHQVLWRFHTLLSFPSSGVHCSEEADGLELHLKMDHLYPSIYMSQFSRYVDDSNESLVVFLLNEYVLLLQLLVGGLFKVLVLFCSTLCPF